MTEADRLEEPCARKPASTVLQTSGGSDPFAEFNRALRPVVLWRKSSFGTQSTTGSDFVERLLTVVASLRQQRRNVLDYATTACEAALHHYPAPSLLPLTALTPGKGLRKSA
jgi:transposase